jgi:hypothetical protein
VTKDDLATLTGAKTGFAERFRHRGDCAGVPGD